MPAYEYTALKAGSQQKIAGRIDADTERDARSKLRARGEVPISITAIQVRGSGLGRWLPTMGMAHQQETLLFTTQLSMLLRSGITLTEGVRVLAEQNGNRDFANTLNLVYQEIVEKGSSFADALSKFPRCFSQLYVSMVRAGESTGTLSEVLLRVAAYAKKKSAIEGRIRSAMTYPIIMCFFGTGIVVFLLSYLVPKITPILKQKGQALPVATELLLAISDIFKNYWWAGLFAAIAAAMLWKGFISTKNGRYAFDSFLLKVPVFGDLNRKAAVSRFCVTLASLLKSGVKIEEALRIIEGVVGNAVIAETIRLVAERIQEGESISGPLMKNSSFPRVVTYMISIGEKAGSEELQEMLENIAEAYDVEIEQSADRLTSMLSPILLMVLAGMVVFILLAILLPIMNLSQLKA